ncbi:hypothetical protein DPMN_159595 [Dreissena polymorpha]|uniref:Uncharacterized protein n=1 Tax=Dreissena polymorpha TaxID=45954 RepID=A0A9D4ELX0_DREPO|nr:hypothetical protein DPMN_159595 [Dreissena polymorpha]
MEVILDDGSVSKDVNEVLDKWNRDFCTLYSRNDEEHINIIADESDTVNEPLFNDGISIPEVMSVIKDAKLGKACARTKIVHGRTHARTDEAATICSPQNFWEA